jgi:hypothetical protein
VRTSAALFVLLALVGCGGPDAPSEAYPAAACPVDDAALCGRAAAAANALASGDVDRLVELSYADEFRCDELPTELFPDCEAGLTLEGHAFTDGDAVIRVLSAEDYRARLAGLGEPTVLGVGTCGPDDPDRRSYHLAFEGDEVLGSLELVRREGEWSVGMLFADTEAGWRKQFASPRTEIACGNVQAWNRP